MAKETTYEEIARELKNRIYKPVYYLMGEESYYIDRISEYIAQTVLNENEKEFNQTIVYGADTDIATVINAAKRYPMMSKYQVVIVKEAQNIKNIEELAYYLQKPLDSTILVLCHKHGTLDRRKKLAAEIEKVGVLFESKKIKDAQLPGFISSYLKRRSVEIEPNIGISKDYNNFELRNALVAKDVFKANQIIKYFEENPKTNPLQMTLSVLFNFFSNLMLAYYAPDKSEQGIANQLGLKSPWQSKDYMAAMRKYSGVKVMQIIGEIRYCDAKSKGVGNPSLEDGDLLRELVYKILH